MTVQRHLTMGITIRCFVKFHNDFLRRYHLFVHLFDGGLVPDLYNSLSVYVKSSHSAQTKYSYSVEVKGR